MKLKDLITAINSKLRGHYSYYGITFNAKGIYLLYEQVKRSLYKWLNRRGGKPKWNWVTFSILVTNWVPLTKPFVYHSYAPA
jgi:RNA-directed DNA polymerase